MLVKMTKPGAGMGGAGSRRKVQAGRLNYSEDKDLPLLLQVSQLQQRFGLSAHRARLVARLAYGEKEKGEPLSSGISEAARRYSSLVTEPLANEEEPL